MSVLVNKKGKGFYEIKGTVYINGKPHYYYKSSLKDKNFKSKKYCEKLEQQIREEIINKYSNKVINITFRTFFNSYKEYKFMTYSEQSKKNFESSYQKHFQNCFDFNNLIADELTVKKYEDFYKYLGKKTFSTSHKNKMLYHAREMANYAKKKHYISDDLKDDLTSILVNFKETTSEENRRKERANNYTSQEDAQKVWESAEYPYNYVFELFYFSGCRISEFLAIKLSDIEFLDNESVITINKQVDHNIKGKLNENLKTSSSYRKIVYNCVATNVLKEYLSTCKFDSNDLIFNFSKTTFRRHLNDCFSNTGVNHNTLHGFGRKSISTKLYMITNNAKVSQIHLGHKNATTTLNSYVDNKPNEKLVLNALEEAVKSSD